MWFVSYKYAYFQKRMSQNWLCNEIFVRKAQNTLKILIHSHHSKRNSSTLIVHAEIHCYILKAAASLKKCVNCRNRVLVVGTYLPREHSKGRSRVTLQWTSHPLPRLTLALNLQDTKHSLFCLGRLTASPVYSCNHTTWLVMYYTQKNP